MSTSRSSEEIDAVAHIAAFHAHDDKHVLARRFDEMARDAFSFMRSTVHLYYRRLAAVSLPPSPLVFGCGDLHVENFGAYFAENRLTYFDQCEFDEAGLMPAAAEMVRFLASIIVALHLHEPDDLEPKRSAKRGLEAYAKALAVGKPQWLERDLARGPIADALSALARRGRRDELDIFSRSARRGRRKLLHDGRHSAPLPRESRAFVHDVKNLLGDIGKQRDERGFWKLRDVARCLAPKGNLGRPRYIALIKGYGDPDGNVLIDIKSTRPSMLALPAEAAQLPWANAAERVVFVQRLIQAQTPAFLQPVYLAKEAFVLSELQLSEDRLDINALLARPRRFLHAIETLARISAWNQLRAAGRKGASDVESLIEFASREGWQRELLATAVESAASVERDYASFETAWRKHDSSLTSLAKP